MVKYLQSTQKQPGCKKSVALFKKMECKKSSKKLTRRKRNGCDGRSMAKTLIMTIQVNFVVIPSEANTNDLFCLSINLPSQPLLGHPAGIHSFFHTVHFLNRATLFCTARLFLCRYQIFSFLYFCFYRL